MQILTEFVLLYCRAKHDDREKAKAGIASISGCDVLLCRECAALVEHGMEKRRKCPLDPKPSCKKCRIHCYGKDYRAKIREIMAFSGRRMIMRGRMDYLLHYFF